jgi:hypothetical protein
MGHGKNSKRELKLWARDAVRDTKFTNQVKGFLLREADYIIENDGLRGDISDRWKKMGYKTSDIPDMYP